MDENLTPGTTEESGSGTAELPPPAEQDTEEYAFEDTPNPDMPEFRYSRVWTNPEDFPGLSYTKNWESSDDFPTIETDEQTVRQDMQSLFDEIAAYLGTDVRSFFAHWLADENYVTWSPYNHTKTYSIGDRVVFGGSSFICLKECTGEDPEDGEYWMVVAEGGVLDLTQHRDLLISLTVDELYSSFSAIADLLVNNLRTDYMRAQRYLDQNTDPIDYLAIHDEEISFWTGSVKYDEQDPPQPLTEQLHRLDTLTNEVRYFWWTDASRTKMTYLTDTGDPVLVYQYDEDYGSGYGTGTGKFPKATFRYEEEPNGQGGTYKVPVLTLGQGVDAGGVNGRARIVKHISGLEISYTTSTGTTIGVWLGDDGFNDLVGLRRITDLDFTDWENGSFEISLEGGQTVSGTVTLSDGVPTKLTVGGVQTTVHI